jgi:hypothetical protein
MARHNGNRRKPAPAAVRRSRKSQATAIREALADLDRLAAEAPKIKHVIELFRGWLTDESGYDEETLPKLKKALDRERARVGARRLFDA